MSQSCSLDKAGHHHDICISPAAEESAPDDAWAVASARSDSASPAACVVEEGPSGSMARYIAGAVCKCCMLQCSWRSGRWWLPRTVRVPRTYR